MRKPLGHPLLLHIIQQNLLQVNHQYAAQPEKQEREAFRPPAWPILRHLSSEHQILVPPPGRLCTFSVAPIIAARSCIPVRP